MKRQRNSAIDLTRLKKAIEKVPFIRLLRMKVVSMGENEFEIRMKVLPKMINYFGSIHGGAIVSLIDTAVYFAIRAILPKEKDLTTTEIKTNFFRGIREGVLSAKVKILYLGNRVAVGEAEIVDHAGRLIAKGTAGHLIIQAE